VPGVADRRQRRVGCPGAPTRGSARRAQTRRSRGCHRLSFARGSPGEACLQESRGVRGTDSQAGPGRRRRSWPEPAGAERQVAGGQKEKHMTLARETKVGLVVAVSFLCLVGVVVAARLRGSSQDPAQVVTPKSSPGKQTAQAESKDGKGT